MTALAAWRMTQGIYRFHQELFEPVWDTPVSGELPVELLFHLPEWCVYVETPGKELSGMPVSGFFASLDDDSNYHRPELRLVIDVEGRLVSFVLHLDKPTLAESIEAVAEHSIRMMQEHSLPTQRNPFTKEFKANMARSCSNLVSVLLYICSATQDMRDAGGSLRQPKNPRPKKIKGGMKIFPAEKPTLWETGYRMGAALTKAKASASTGESMPHGSPAPHIRRAHWHSFWQGPKSEPDRRTITVKWLPPLPVAVGDMGEVIPTIRIVK